MSKNTIKTIFLIFGIGTWILLFLLVITLVRFIVTPFAPYEYDVSQRLTSPDYQRTALLVRVFNFDLNFRLYIVDDPSESPSNDWKDALWITRDYNPDQSINYHEDLEWSKDSSVITVIIEGAYIFAYDFNFEKEYKDEGEIKHLLESRNNP